MSTGENDTLPTSPPLPAPDDSNTSEFMSANVERGQWMLHQPIRTEIVTLASPPLPAPTGSASRWDCHAHRDELQVSDAATVYHREQGQLCFLEKHWDCYLWHPIRFKDRAAAQTWIESGCIADIQEAACNLGVGFTTKCFIARA